MSTNAGTASSGVTFPVFPSEKPSVAQAKAWRLQCLDMMPSDWKAVMDGITPHSLIGHMDRPVPGALVESAVAPLVTNSMVESREQLIEEITYQNNVRAEQRLSGAAQLRHSLFEALRRSLRPNAPLLLARLEAAHPLAGAYAAWRDGPAAFAALEAQFAPATALETEADAHEDHLTALRLKPLPDGCSSDEFGARVNDALNNHIPFLRRPFPVGDGSLGKWVIAQMPAALAADGRRLAATKTVAELCLGQAIAADCLAIVAAGETKSVRDGVLGEFLGIADESSYNGRRPHGLHDGRGRGTSSGGRGGTTGGKGPGGRGSGGGGSGSGKPRATSCSTPPPRGPTCRFNHPPPCFRDPAFEGPLPMSIWKNKTRLAEVISDRKAMATKLHEPCFELKPPVESGEETVAVMEDVEYQFGDQCDPCYEPMPDLAAAQELNDQLAAQLDLPPARSPFVEPTRVALSAAAMTDINIRLDVPRTDQAAALAAGAIPTVDGWYPARGADLLALVAWMPRDGHLPVPRLDVTPTPAPRDPTLMVETIAPPTVDVTEQPSTDAVAPTAAPSPPQNILPNAAEALPAVLPLAAPDPVVTSPVMRMIVGTVVMLLCVLALAGAGLAHWAMVLLSSIAEHGGVSVAISGAAQQAYGTLSLTCATSPIACGIGSSAAILLISSRVDQATIATRLAALGRAIYDLARQQAIPCVLIIFLWVKIMYSHAITSADLEAYNDMVIRHSSNETLNMHIQLASRVAESWTNTMVLPNMPTMEELIMVSAETGIDSDQVFVMDSGARRSVVRDPAAFRESSRRPCNFKIRGVLGNAGQPEFMGDAEILLPVSDSKDGTPCRMAPVVLQDAVCLPSCPHDVVALGPLMWSGCTVYLAPKDERSWLRLTTSSFVQIYNRGIIFADGRLPANASTVSTTDTVVVPSPSPAPSNTTFYMCSGPRGNTSGFAAWWRFISKGGKCDEYDRMHGDGGDMLYNKTFAPFFAAIAAGNYVGGLLTPPCGQFNPRRLLFPHPRFPVLRSIVEHGLGVKGLAAPYQHAVDRMNVLIQRICLVARAMTDLKRPWILENPPSRSDETGIFKRFFRENLRLHASLFDVPCVVALAEYADALFVHVPMCFFGMPEQKYLSLMYPSYMHGAMQCLGSIECHHESHPSVTGGFDANGEPLGAETGVHPGGLSEAIARAFAHPNRPCMLSHDVMSAPTTGLSADRTGVPTDAITRGKKGKQSNVTSRLVHDRFHRPASVLRSLHYTCNDIPVSWTKLLDVEQSCDACLRAKAVHQHHGDGALPVTTKCGEIVAFDLWTTQSPCILGGERTLFGVIDLHSDFSDVTKLKYKTAVPDAIAQFIAFAASVGVTIARMHTDNEFIFHTEDAREATKARFRAQGVLITTGCEYASRQNSKIERLWRTIAGDGRASLLNAPELNGTFYISAVVDANQKRNVLPYADDNKSCPYFKFTGVRPSAAVHRVFGSLVYVTLDHQLNQSAARLTKHGERAVPGILLGYSRDGTVFDRRRPGWVCYVPEYHMHKPIITPHVTVLEYIRPSPLRLRNLSLTPADEIERTPISLRVNDGGEAEDAPSHLPPTDADDGLTTPEPAASGAPPIAHVVPTPITTTIASRLPARTGSRYAGADRGDIVVPTAAPIVIAPPEPVLAPPDPAGDTIAGRLGRTRTAASRLTYVAGQASGSVAESGGGAHPHGDDDLPVLSSWDYSGDKLAHGSFDPACPLAAYDMNVTPCLLIADPPTPAAPPWPDTFIGSASIDGGNASDIVDFTSPASNESVLRHSSQGVPDRVVHYPWGDVPYEWAAGYDNSVMFHTEIDCTVDGGDIYTSLEVSDDPSYHQAMRGPDRLRWYDARDDELGALVKLGVVEAVPADSVPVDADIYDTMMLCKKKRGQDNVVTKFKMRCVLCGNQQVAASARRATILNTDIPPLRTHSPTIRHCTYKLVAGAGVVRGMRRRGFDVSWAYLQGDGAFMGQRVYARAPVDCRQYDERGVEMVWLLHRPLYGGPDAGRAWYLTFHAWLTGTDESFLRCDSDACLFDRVLTVGRITLNLYVDDGSTWDSNATECDAFYERLGRRFTITGDPGVFFLGMDHIDHACGSLTLCSRTYILGLCQRELPRPLSEYKDVQIPADPRLMEFYETAFQLHIPPTAQFGTKYRSLVGGLGWVGPTTRPDVLHTVGILQRAYTFPTDDLFGCATQALIYLGQTADMGITFSASAPDAGKLRAAVDSDWSVRRSTSGGCLLLAGAAAHAVSRRQDCSAESSTAAEVVAASTFVGDISYGVNVLNFIGLEQQAVRVDMDSQPAADIAQDYSASNRTKHLARRDFRIREAAFAALITIRRVASADNVADIFTKVFSRQPFQRLRRWVLGAVTRSLTSVSALLVSAARMDS